MTANAWIFFETFKERLGDGTIDLDGDTFKVGLLDSNYTPNLNTNVDWADISGDEITAANGYTAGGATVGSVTWVEASGTVTFDTADIVWTASGGSIAAARYAVWYDDTVTTPEADVLVAHCLMDNTPADVGPITDTNTLTLQINASGMFTLA